VAASSKEDRAQQEKDEELLRRINQELGREKRKHDALCVNYRARYRAWTGVLEREQDVWESQLAPMYAFQKIDTLIANLVDRQPKGIVRPCRPGAEDFAAAEALQKLMNEFRRRDGDTSTQRQHVQQACVMGISPRKTYHRYERGLEVWRELEDAPTGPGALPAPGQPPPPRKLVRKQGEVTRYNQPARRVVPVQDFFWDPSASHSDDCAWQAARYWVTPKHVKDFARDGVYREAAAAAACESRSSPQKSDEIGADSVDRDGRIEVLEYWERNMLVTMANRTVILRAEEHPYWHRLLPFDIATTMTDLYRVEGFSEIELIAQLQAGLWDLLNQRIDNTRFMSNAALIVQEGTTITEEGIFPGAILTTDGDPNRTVVPWTPPTSIIQPSLQASQELKQDIDDVTGVTPYVSGAGSQTLDQQTATQISTFQSMASRRLESKRTQIFECERGSGMQTLALIQQFMESPQQIRGEYVGGEDGYQWDTIEPQKVVKALLEYDIDMTDESMDRQQRRQEAMTLATLGMQLSQIADLQGTVIDVGELFKRAVEAFDAPPEKYVRPKPPPPPPPPTVVLPPGMDANALSNLAGSVQGGNGQPPPPDSGNGSAVPLLPPPPGA
jgi:hypothetical protein